MLRKIVGPKKGNLIRGWENVCDGELMKLEVRVEHNINIGGKRNG
jgi:hypothetical protein